MPNALYVLFLHWATEECIECDEEFGAWLHAVCHLHDGGVKRVRNDCVAFIL